MPKSDFSSQCACAGAPHSENPVSCRSESAVRGSFLRREKSIVSEAGVRTGQDARSLLVINCLPAGRQPAWLLMLFHSAPLLCLRGGAQAQVLPVASCCISATSSWHLISLSKARQPTTSYLLSTAAWLHTLVCTGVLPSHKLQAVLPQGLGAPSFGVDSSRGTADQTLLAEFTRTTAGAGLPPLTHSQSPASCRKGRVPCTRQLHLEVKAGQRLPGGV